MKEYFEKYAYKDFLSSIVVFLVALPLCMGIAIASGVPPILGLMSGIVGGLVVGTFAGCPLQVSGPAAGLAVMVFEFINKFGIEALAPLGVVVGATQLVIYRLKLAAYFKAISPALIKGLLSGIGLLILASQLHVALDSGPVGGGLTNLLHVPGSFYELVIMEGGGRVAFIVSLTTLVSILLWQRFGGKMSSILPAPLFAILVVVGGTLAFETDIKFVTIPKDVIGGLNFITMESFSVISPAFIISALAIAFVATAETLLSVSAVDKLSGKGVSNYNKEAMAQGIGNMVAGFFGALPITGVIVRSSANVESGGQTRGAAIMHAVWLFCLVFFFTEVLALIPVSALAGILIYVGWKLLDLKSMSALVKKSKAEAGIYFVTFATIVSVDLLTGVILGFMTSIAVLVYKLQKLEINVEEKDNVVHVNFAGAASFLQVPQIDGMLSQAEKENKEIVVDVSNLKYMDWAVEEQINSWKDINEKKGNQVKVNYKNVA